MHPPTIQSLARARWRIALTLTAAMVVLYFGFILLIAYDKPLLAHQVVPGLSVGILLGALVIVASWLMTWIYMRWANRHYDPVLKQLKENSTPPSR
ncbi:MAG: DUF485 domain-containing protein [Gemmatimonadota bacterium]